LDSVCATRTGRYVGDVDRSQTSQLAIVIIIYVVTGHVKVDRDAGHGRRIAERQDGPL